MEKVVYFLGAGFSAPLGIPVMKNFFEKSKDMYFNDKEKYKGGKKRNLKCMEMGRDSRWEKI